MADDVAWLRRLLQRMAPIDERHAGSIDEVLAALAHLERPFDERADPTHVTASAIVVGPRGTLLHRHKRLGLWLQPGGHIEPGESPPAAALRETLEETGVPARHPDEGPALVHVDAHDGGRGHRHLDLRYLLRAGEEDPAPPDGESQQVRWFDWPAAVALADPGLAGALRQLTRTAGRQLS